MRCQAALLPGAKKLTSEALERRWSCSHIFRDGATRPAGELLRSDPVPRYLMSTMTASAKEDVMHATLAAIVALDIESGLPIILILVLVLFGGGQLPKLARALGSAQREFKKGLEEGADDKDKDKNKAKPESTSD